MPSIFVLDRVIARRALDCFDGLPPNPHGLAERGARLRLAVRAMAQIEGDRLLPQNEPYATTTATPGDFDRLHHASEGWDLRPPAG